MTDSFNLEDRVVAAIRRIIRAVDLHSRHLAEQYGLTGPQLVTLQEAARLGEVSAGVLARAIHLSQATVTGVLDRLERQGLVARARSSPDRRAVMVTVTDRGRTLLDSAPSLLQDRFRRELRRLEEWEQTAMLATLQRVAAMMDAEEIEASPMLVSGSFSPDVDECHEQSPTPTEPVMGATQAYASKKERHALKTK